MINTRLEYLFLLHTRRAISPAEREELMTLIEDPASDEDLQELIGRVIEGTDETIPLPGETSRAILETILQTPAPQRIPVVPLRTPIRWWRYAAAAILICLIATGAWFALFRKLRTPVLPSNELVAAHDLKPGGNKAVLTLGNGARIILDSAENGVVAQQGATKVVKLKNGQIAYTPSISTDAATVYNTMTTPRGGQYRLTLPDGTEVWLNAASSITYPTAFAGAEREVTITGEAYFEVVHKEKHPFRVKAGNAFIEVLGTHFNINAYPDEPSVNATLLEGRIKLGQGNHEQLMAPGEQGKINPGGMIELLKGVDTDQVMAWKNGKFRFGDKTDIATIMRQVARWYDIELEYQGAVTGHIGGSISRNVPAAQVFKMLEKTGAVHFKIEGKKVTVMP